MSELNWLNNFARTSLASVSTLLGTPLIVVATYVVNYQVIQLFVTHPRPRHQDLLAPRLLEALLLVLIPLLSVGLAYSSAKLFRVAITFPLFFAIVVTAIALVGVLQIVSYDN